MQNLSLVAPLLSEIWRAQVIKFGYLLPENESNFKKRVFMSRIGLLDPKFTPHVNFSNFQAEKNVFILKRAAATPWLINLLKFCQNVS